MTFSENFIEVFNFLSSKIGIGIDWTSQNVWPYLTDITERIMTYLMIKESVYVVGWLISVIALSVLTVYLIKKTREHFKKNTGAEIIFAMFTFFSLAAFSASIVNLFNYGMTLLQMYFLPEATLIEFITSITNQIM